LREAAGPLRAASAAVITFGRFFETPKEDPALTKSEFIEHVSSTAELTKKEAESAVEAVISSIQKALAAGNEVNITGFGKFHVAERGARQGKHPRTGETMNIPAAKVPRFSAGAKLKQAVKD
jgi:DNA-binding protein HU-beta